MQDMHAITNGGTSTGRPVYTKPNTLSPQRSIRRSSSSAISISIAFKGARICATPPFAARCSLSWSL